MAGCGCKECGIPSPLGDRFCVIRREARKPDWGPTVHPRRKGADSPGRQRVALGLCPAAWGWGFRDSPPPQAIIGLGAGTGELSPATAVGISQHGPKRGELEGGTEGARRRRRPPAHPAPCATGRGTRTPGRSRLEGLALHSAVQGP